jgi:hypothetical protein
MKKPILHLREKAAIAVLMMIFLFMVNPNLIAQAPYANQSLLMVAEKNESPLKCIKNFSLSIYNDIVYLNLVMKGEPDNSVFLLERSQNNIDFTAIDKKNGFAAPNMSTEILYSFKDQNPNPGTNYYRIKQFRNDGILYSYILSVYLKEEVPLVQNQTNE